MASNVLIGGQPVVRLTAPKGQGGGFVSADLLPGRGLMTLQIRARTERLGEFDLLDSPSPEEAARLLDGGPEDFAGSRAFSFGAALLIPYANRIRGRLSANGRAIETEVLGRSVELPANWGGKRPGAERYAMHGLILDAAVANWRVWREGDAEVLTARLDAGDFGGRWLSSCRLDFRVALNRSAFSLKVQATNVGEELLPVGIGWHPWFTLPSGRREQVRMTLPAASRALVNDYDEVLPTGAVAAVEGTPYDFRRGRTLDDLYLDDCFTDLERQDGVLYVAFHDLETDFALSLRSRSQAVRAVQVYAPSDRPVLVIEPQFNLADPYGEEWGGRNTGMAVLRPGETAAYDVQLSLSGANRVPRR